MIKIRRATSNDLEEINEIYNEAVLKTVATFDTRPKKMEEQEKWFEGHGAKNPILVAEQDENIVGWSALSKYSIRCAYSGTAEISLYVKKECQGKGFGTKLMDAIIQEGKKAGLHVIIARITEGNRQSVRLHESVGFEHIGIMKEVGLKFGKRLDVYLMQKTYNATSIEK